MLPRVPKEHQHLSWRKIKESSFSSDLHLDQSNFSITGPQFPHGKIVSVKHDTLRVQKQSLDTCGFIQKPTLIWSQQKKKLSQSSNLYNIPYFVSFDLHYYFQLDQEDSAYLGRKKGKTFQYLWSKMTLSLVRGTFWWELHIFLRLKYFLKALFNCFIKNFHISYRAPCYAKSFSYDKKVYFFKCSLRIL